MGLLPGFPLLVKELSEQAARKRTYVLRSLYAVGLMLAFALMYHTTARMWDNSRMGMVGLGGELFDSLIYTQYWAILLLMPGLAASALTSEKEQGSLTILMLTDLGPWELLLQKWWSRVMLVGSFLLLGMPLMGLCYAYGGLETERLALGLGVLVLVCLQTAAVAIAVSAWCRGSIAALLGTYALLALLYLGPELLLSVVKELVMINDTTSRITLNHADFLWPLRLFDHAWSSRTRSLGEHLLGSLPILGSVVGALLFTRWALPRRAQLGGSGPLLRLLRWLDALFERGDAALGRPRGAGDLPDRAPVAWRELNRRSLANWRYLVRFLILGVVAVIGLLTLIGMSSSWDTFLTSLQVIGLSLLAISLVLGLVLGATVIATERMQQTLDVLLTTPLEARTILVEKLRGLRRIIWSLVVPAFLLMAWHGYDQDLGVYYRSRTHPNLFATLAYFVILPPLFTWFAIAIGLVMRNRNRAVITALIGGCLWLASTLLIGAVLFGIMRLEERSLAMVVCYLTPGMLPLINETNGPNNLYGGLPLAMTMFVVWHGALWLGLRWWCLRNADRLMRRGGGS